MVQTDLAVRELMVKEIIFDCFGVLTEDGWLAFARQFETEENSEELRYLNHQIDRGLLPYEQFLGRVVELTEASKEEAHRMITTSHHPNEQLFAYIKELKAAGYELGIISNVGSEINEFLAEEYISLFDRVTLSYQVAAIKPEPLIYQAHLEKSGHRPEEVIFIDDRMVNCEGARIVGMKSIHYQNVTQIRHELDLLLAK